MNLKTTIEFLERLYDQPSTKNLTRLEHEAIGEAIRRLRDALDSELGEAKTRLGRVVPLRKRNNDPSDR